MIRYHHERWDGMGYPAGLKASEIPFGARVIAVADAFDAMTSDRTYRKALSTEQAVQTLLDGRGTQWDPKIVMAFLGHLAQKSGQKAGSRSIVTSRESFLGGV
jgi:HD-GYP domain-containing protein (c-di-GMP phosphodiesterase class II)